MATLTVERIPDWADWHHRAKGFWPRPDSGPIAGVPGETWGTINAAVARGLRGLPGGMNLTQLQVQHRGEPAKNHRPDLTVEQILGWADDYFESSGGWSRATFHPVAGAPENTWHHVDTMLRTYL